jgi:hypothetical protein
MPSEERPPLLSRRISRREALRGALLSAAGASAVALGCGDDGDEPDPPPTTVAEPTTPTLPSPSPGAAAGWRQIEVAAGPSARRDHSLTWDAQARRVYLFGGRSGGSPLADLWSLDPDAPTWQQLAPSGEGPAARFGHNAVFDAEGRLLVFGGQGAGAEFFDDVWTYVPAENRWEPLDAGAGPASRYGAGAALDANGALWITHGFTFMGRFDDTWSLAGGAWQEASPPEGPRPIERCLLRAAFDDAGGRLIIFGGQTDSDPFLGDTWSFDVATRTWSELTIAVR